MPRTLWRMILLDFWKQLLITTAVVVCAISFAVTVKPIADGSLSAAQALRFMGYAIPPMLAYALPFAACFSATMTYYRMVDDNEVIAAHASGISHKSLLTPMLISGVALGSFLIALNTQIIPIFLQRMEEMVTRDFAKILVNSLAQGRTAMIGETEIHADRVEPVDPEPGSPIEQQFLLGGVVMVEPEIEGLVRVDGTARRAWIQLMPAWALPESDRERIGDDNATAVIMKFVDLTVNERGDAVTWESVVSPAIPIPRVFKDDPKFMTSSDMRRLIEHPDEMNFVNDRRVELARSIAMARVGARIESKLERGEDIVLGRGGDGAVRIRAGSVTQRGVWWDLEPREGADTVEVLVDRPGGRRDVLLAKQARLGASARGSADPFTLDNASRGLSLTLELREITIRATTETQMAQTQYKGLAIEDDPLLELIARPSDEVLDEAQAHRSRASLGYDHAVAVNADNLEYEIEHLGREVLSKIHERWAFAATGLVIVLTGAVTAMRLREAQPLVIYLWSFFPALLAIILIAGGQQATHQQGHVGLVLLWSGVGVISLYTLNALRKVQRF